MSQQNKKQSLRLPSLVQVETGNPYMLYKDTCNRKSNQQNLGTIKCSNLCTEIMEYTSPEETAVCNLASLALPKLIGSLDAANRYNSSLHFQHKLLLCYISDL